jgi:hypothetical protein
VATDTFVVVSGYIASGSILFLVDAIDSNLRAINHAVIALKAHATAHAAFGFGGGLLWRQTDEAFFEVPKYLFGSWDFFPAL